MTGKKLVVLVLLLGLFGSAGAAADFVVDGLEEEGINRTFTADGMRFTTDYMNQTLPFKNATYPDELHDDLTKWSYSTTIKENSSQLDFQSEWNSSVTGVLGSVIDALAGRKVNETIDVKKGETKSTLYNGSLDDDSGDLAVNVTATAHYEHLVLAYEVYYSNGTLAGTYQNTYSDTDTERVPFANSDLRNGYSATINHYATVLSLGYDNRYEPAHNITAVVAVPTNYSLELFRTGSRGGSWRLLQHGGDPGAGEQPVQRHLAGQQI